MELRGFEPLHPHDAIVVLYHFCPNEETPGVGLRGFFLTVVWS